MMPIPAQLTDARFQLTDEKRTIKCVLSSMKNIGQSHFLGFSTRKPKRRGIINQDNGAVFPQKRHFYARSWEIQDP